MKKLLTLAIIAGLLFSVRAIAAPKTASTTISEKIQATTAKEVIDTAVKVFAVRYPDMKIKNKHTSGIVFNQKRQASSAQRLFGGNLQDIDITLDTASHDDYILATLSIAIFSHREDGSIRVMRKTPAKDKENLQEALLDIKKQIEKTHASTP